MSLRYWDLDWSEHLPWQLEDGLVIDHARFDDVWPFIRDRYAEIFEVGDGGSGFLEEPMTDAKWRFLLECDVFVFRDGARIVGLSVCHPTDWSSYYFRSTAIVREYQDRRLVSVWAERCMAVLARHGVARIDGDTSPSNLASMRMLIRLGFNVTASSNSERWGALVRLTKFLRRDAESAFLDRFCHGVRYQRRDVTPQPQERRTT